MEVEKTSSRCRLDSQFTVEDFAAACVEIADEKSPTPAMVQWAFGKMRGKTSFPVKPGDFEYWLDQYASQPVNVSQHYRPHYTDEPIAEPTEADKAAVKRMHEEWQGRRRKQKAEPVDTTPGPHVATREQNIRRLMSLRNLTREQAEQTLGDQS